MSSIRKLLSSSSRSIPSPFGNPSSSFSPNPLSSIKTLYFYSTNVVYKPVEHFATSDDFQFKLPLKIVEYPDPRLRAKNKMINTFDDYNLKNLVAEMFDVMYKTDSIMLSAPHVGINLQLMVFNSEGERGIGEEQVFINPRMIKFSGRRIRFTERCLSFPGLYAVIKRPHSVKFDAKGLSGEKICYTLEEFPARVFQHEVDLLKGTLFFERMTDKALNNVREGLQALEVKYQKITGLPSPERIENWQSKETAVDLVKS